MTSSAFATRWRHAGGAERANGALFLTELCDVLGVPHPNAVTHDPAQDTYLFERPVMFDNGPGVKATGGRIDLYKRGCFVLETKQGVGQLEKVSGVGQQVTSTNENTASAAARQRGSAAAHKWV